MKPDTFVPAAKSINSRIERIILASASPRRFELLSSLGLDVVVVPSAYAEPALEHLTPLQLAVTHAREKAADVRRHRTDLPLVAADTVVDVDGRALGKPSDRDEAMRMLQTLSGRDHLVHTAFTFIAENGARCEDAQTTRVRFFALSPPEIEAYVASGDPMDKAGAYGIQGTGATLVERIDGDFYTVMGFPLGRFVRSLERLGFEVRSTNKTADT